MMNSNEFNQLPVITPFWSHNIFFIWCGDKRPFTFINYLSVRSAIVQLNPTSITLVFEKMYPGSDKEGYNTWLEELEKDFPFWQRQQMPSGANVCMEENWYTWRTVYSMLHSLGIKEGGLVMGIRTLLVKPQSIGKSKSITNAPCESIQGFYFIPSVDDSIIESNDVGIGTLSCVSGFNFQLPQSPPVVLSNEITPVDIMYRNNSWLAGYSRFLLYGHWEPVSLHRDPASLVPLVGHYIMAWWRRSQQWLLYLSPQCFVHCQTRSDIYPC